MLEQPVPEGLYPVGGTHTGAVCEELQPLGRVMLEKLMENCPPARGTPHRSKGECEESSL